jgi:cytolysin-activating lysine-acyltransferase
MIEYSPAPLDHVIHLLAHSDIHRKFTMEQADKLFIPPVNLRQNIGIFEFGHLVAWASWMFTDREKADRFLNGEYKLTPPDWSSGDVLVFVDFVAPFGHTRKLYRQCRNLFPEYPKAEWRRHKKSRRVNSALKVCSGAVA